MNLNITKQEKQPLLSRIEVVAKVGFQGATPSNEELRKAIAVKLKTDESLTVIKHIYTKFGSQEADVESFVYDDKKVMAVLEKKAKKQKEKEAKAKESVQKEKEPEKKKDEPVEKEKSEDKAEEKAEDKEKKEPEKKKDEPVEKEKSEDKAEEKAEDKSEE